MKIKIISDSTCDLPLDILEKYDIDTVPLLVMKDGSEFIDGITITPADIFAHVDAGGSLCSTAARNAGVYHDVFAKYTDSFDGIIHISLGSGFSSSYQNACIAAMDFENVRVVDSGSLCVAQGLIAMKAWEFGQTATDLDALKAQVDDFASRVEGSFVLDRLDYMVKGGRCSSTAALGANLLNLKPCIELKDGKLVVVKKYRGHYEKCLVNYIKDRLANRSDLDHGTLFLVHTTVPEGILNAVRKEIDACEPFDTVIETDAGCTISCHCGPGTLGVMFVRK